MVQAIAESKVHSESGWAGVEVGGVSGWIEAATGLMAENQSLRMTLAEGVDKLGEVLLLLLEGRDRLCASLRGVRQTWWWGCLRTARVRRRSTGRWQMCSAVLEGKGGRAGCHRRQVCGRCEFVVMEGAGGVQAVKGEVVIGRLVSLEEVTPPAIFYRAVGMGSTKWPAVLGLKTLALGAVIILTLPTRISLLLCFTRTAILVLIFRSSSAQLTYSICFYVLIAVIRLIVASLWL